MRMKGYSSRTPSGEAGSAVAPGRREAPFGALMLAPDWKETPAVPNAAGPYRQHLALLCEPDEATRKRMETGALHIRRIVLQSEHEEIGKRFQDHAIQAFERIRGVLKNKASGKTLVQVVVFGGGERRLFSGLSGLLKTARLENPNLVGQLIEIDDPSDASADTLVENGGRPGDDRIRYRDGKRWVAGWRDVDAFPVEPGIPWKENGVYLITGGTGGLGRIFAEEITRRVKRPTLILAGRSQRTDVIEARLEALEDSGATVVYKQVDVTRTSDVAHLIGGIQKDFGRLTGVLHAAGVTRDNFLIKKTVEEAREVLAPKVAGLVNLDRASRDLPLDFFVLFSSMAGALGNAGQADYACANAFMDAYAAYRNGRVESGRRHGKTLSIDWPLWKGGGMRVSEETETMMAQRTGLVVMETAAGIRAFHRGMAHPSSRLLVLTGDRSKIRQTLLSRSAPADPAPRKRAPIPPKPGDSAVSEDPLREKAVKHLTRLLSSVIRMPLHRIDVDAPMEKYGIDSFMVIQLTNRLEKAFGSLSKTLFFEYRTIREITDYFMESHRGRLTRLLHMEPGAEAPADRFEDGAVAPETPLVSGLGRRRFTPVLAPAPKEAGRSPDIAIIGLAGRYPKAENIGRFWDNLREGRDCIEEIPKERWDYERYFDKERSQPGKTYSKWGGFLSGVDRFDPLFFNIAPREAELMDPQERLFLTCVFETLEDAGYTRESLGPRPGVDPGGPVGVFAGVMYEEYQLYGAQAQTRGRAFALSGLPASIANRVSYFCDFQGPSMTVETMCSSSLTAIHLACQSLRQGECGVAAAGGVNVSVHPNKYLLLAQGQFVSSAGRCESFGQGGDGYTPAEGVGAVLLKPLPRAMADRDHIYGVIKGTAVNHGGKTNGYTVPNPNAQGDVIGRAIAEARIDPRVISYIEAHGTGTSLGDPIEIAGLNKAFREHTDDKQFCAIGSAKSNIGHCESAAGIAGVTKVLLQLKHRQLAPSLHSETLNPNIDFNNSPFVVQHKLAEWKRPVAALDGETREYPRIAGVSSFGAGGSNAHLIIQEPPEPGGPGKDERIWEYKDFERQETKSGEIPKSKGRYSLIGKSLNREGRKGGNSLIGKTLNREGRKDRYLDQITSKSKIQNSKFETKEGRPQGTPLRPYSTNHPTIQSSSHPVIQPSSHPVIQPSSHPPIQSSSQIIVLSAKNEDRLKAQARNLLAWLQERQLITEQSNDEQSNDEQRSKAKGQKRTIERRTIEQSNNRTKVKGKSEGRFFVGVIRVIRGLVVL